MATPKTPRQPTVTIDTEATPSQQLVREVTGTVSLEPDPKGRVYTLTRPSVLAQFRLVALVGNDLAQNSVWMGMVLPIVFVTAINGETIYFPTTFVELEALIQRYDEAGIAHIQAGMEKHFETQKAPEQVKAEIKN